MYYIYSTLLSKLWDLLTYVNDPLKKSKFLEDKEEDLELEYIKRVGVGKEKLKGLIMWL